MFSPDLVVLTRNATVQFRQRNPSLASSGEETQGSTISNIFPLPLTPFERMMLLEDRSSYPMTCRARFSFLGKFDPTQLEASYRDAIQQHPLLSATLETRRNRIARWVSSRPNPIAWQSEDRELNVRRFDLRREPGLQTRVVPTSEGHSVVFDFHHACADGVGGIAFVEDLLVAYAARSATKPTAVPQRQPALLHQRGRYPNPKWYTPTNLLNDVDHLWRTAQFLVRNATPVERPSVRIYSSDAKDDLILSRTLDSETLIALRRAAAAGDSTVNDLMITAMLLVSQDWNQRHGPGQRSERFRLLVPVNLRSRSDVAMPAANRIGYAFVERTSKGLRDDSSVLRSVQNETSRIRTDRAGERSLSRMGWISKIPHALKLACRQRCCPATAVISSIGDPTRRFQTRFPRRRGHLVIGNVELTELTGVTPIRPLTKISVFTNMYANRLNLGAQFDPETFRRAEADLFLDQLIQCISAIAETAKSAARAA